MILGKPRTGPRSRLPARQDLTGDGRPPEILEVRKAQAITESIACTFTIEGIR